VIRRDVQSKISFEDNATFDSLPNKGTARVVVEELHGMGQLFDERLPGRVRPADIVYSVID
jgi:hypothetical protein